MRPATLLLAALTGIAAPARAWDVRVPLPPVPCAVFPPDNVWNADVSALPVHPRSADYVRSVGEGVGLHPDFGTRKIGIPYAVASAARAPAAIVFTAYGDESDPGPYPVPRAAPRERGSDRHVLVVQEGTCRLYELFAARRKRRGALWRAASGAITHALRFTVPHTQSAYVWPARHEASSDPDAALPPMGMRFRLRADVDLSGFSAANRVILTALKRHGMFVADNGSAWFVTGAPDPRWDNEDLHLVGAIHGTDFEAVDESSLMLDPDSGQVR
jgi:hypothetical protein